MPDTPGYQYQVVTYCGAGRYTDPTTFPRAVEALRKVLDEGHENAEIERVQTTRAGRRYWLRRGGRWRIYPDRAFDPGEQDYAYWRDRAAPEKPRSSEVSS